MMNNEHEYTNGRNMADRPVRRSTQPTHQTKGRYLKDPHPSRRRRRRRRRLNPRFVVLMAILLAMLIGIAIGIRSCTKPSLNGKWDLDGTTVYEFSKGGKGALVLQTIRYEFTYEIDGNTVLIDFEDEAALDAKYDFEVKNNMLFLTGGPGDARTDYVLTKMD